MGYLSSKLSSKMQGLRQTLRLAVHSDRSHSFHNINNAPLSTSLASNWAYPYPKPATGVAYTLPADSEVTFDGTTWLSSNGLWPEGASKWKVKVLSSGANSTLISYTLTLDGANWPIRITTLALALSDLMLEQAGTHILTQDGEYLQW